MVTSEVTPSSCSLQERVAWNVTSSGTCVWPAALFATLTGTCVQSLGNRYSGVFTNRDELIPDLMSAGKRSGAWATGYRDSSGLLGSRPKLVSNNNNFIKAEGPFPTKIARASLTLSTFIALYSYGYRNVYELGPQLDARTTPCNLATLRPRLRER